MTLSERRNMVVSTGIFRTKRHENGHISGTKPETSPKTSAKSLASTSMKHMHLWLAWRVGECFWRMSPTTTLNDTIWTQKQHTSMNKSTGKSFGDFHKDIDRATRAQTASNSIRDYMDSNSQVDCGTSSSTNTCARSILNERQAIGEFTETAKQLIWSTLTTSWWYKIDFRIWRDWSHFWLRSGRSRTVEMSASSSASK